MNILAKAANKFFSIAERFFSTNWFNPFATIYVNFRSLPFCKAIKLPIWMYGRPRLMCLLGTIDIQCKIKTGIVRFNYINIGSPSNMGSQSELYNAGTIIFAGPARIRTGNRIVVGYKAKLRFGANLIMGDYINIGCFDSISIGNNVRIAHRSQIFDSNYHFVANLNKRIVPAIKHPIVIGDYCWICNTSSISGGTNLPVGTIVSTNSLVNKKTNDIPPYSIIGGIPAKLIGSGYRLVNNPVRELEISLYYSQTENSAYTLPDEFDESEWFNL